MRKRIYASLRTRAIKAIHRSSSLLRTGELVARGLPGLDDHRFELMRNVEVNQIFNLACPVSLSVINTIQGRPLRQASTAPIVVARYRTSSPRCCSGAISRNSRSCSSLNRATSGKTIHGNEARIYLKSQASPGVDSSVAADGRTHANN